MSTKMFGNKVLTIIFYGVIFTVALTLNLTRTDGGIFLSISSAVLLAVYFAIVAQIVSNRMLIHREGMKKIKLHSRILRWISYISVVAILMLQIKKWVTGISMNFEPFLLLSIMGTNGLHKDIYVSTDRLIMMSRNIVISDIKEINVKKQYLNYYSLLVIGHKGKVLLGTSIKKESLEELINSNEQIAKLITSKVK